MRTILVYKERAIEKFVVPWFIVTVNAVIIATLQHVIPLKMNWEVPNISMVTSTLGTCLAFLLVFRLNRAAVRWWNVRQMWGDIVRDSRVLVSAILENMTPDFPKERDMATAWVCGFVIASKDFLGGYKAMKFEQLAGILNNEQIEALQNQLVKGNHPALFAASELRHVLRDATRVYPDTPTSLAIAYTSEMKHYERYVHSLITMVGGMERVRATPLPIVYVTHLRTFLFIFLMVMPYIYGNAWDWWCIPYVSTIAFLLLGVDGAASECEIPFSNQRANHLNMSAYCLLALRNIQQLVVHSAHIHMPIDTEKGYQALKAQVDDAKGDDNNV